MANGRLLNLRHKFHYREFNTHQHFIYHSHASYFIHPHMIYTLIMLDQNICHTSSCVIQCHVKYILMLYNPLCYTAPCAIHPSHVTVAGFTTTDQYLHWFTCLLTISKPTNGGPEVQASSRRRHKQTTRKKNVPRSIVRTRGLIGGKSGNVWKANPDQEAAILESRCSLENNTRKWHICRGRSISVHR